MNSTITFPPAEPSLKLSRTPAEKWAASLAEERRRLQEDHDALREREQNLRDYESRLRSLQAEIESGRTAPVAATSSNVGRPVTALYTRPSSQVPFQEDTVLQGAWEKLHRSREILEAEQKNLRDDRIAVRELEVQVKKREELVAVREQALEERAALIAEAAPWPEPMAGEHTMSAVTKLTRGPFNMARSVFGGKK